MSDSAGLWAIVILVLFAIAIYIILGNAGVDQLALIEGAL